MYKFIPLGHESKNFPHLTPMALCINTNTWKIGLARHEYIAFQTIETEIQFLCFSFEWRKFIEDIQMLKGAKE